MPLLTTRAGASARAYGWGKVDTAVNAFEAIASQTISVATNSITFSSIPQKYKDLHLVCSARGVGGLDAYYLRFNGDTAGNYAVASMSADPASGVQPWEFGTETRYQANIALAYNTTYYNTTLIDIYSYSQANVYKSAKSVFYSDNAGTNSGEGIEYSVGLWRNTSAITTLNISNNYNFAVGSVFALYGIGVS